MNQIAIQDLDINQELDNLSLGNLIGGHRCHGHHRPRRVCKKVLISYFKKIRVLRKKTVFYFKTIKVRAFKTALLCYWR